MSRESLSVDQPDCQSSRRYCELPAGPSRRDLLKLGASGVVAGLAGCSLPSSDAGDGPAPEPGTAASSPRLSEFEFGEPPMETPWTGDVDPANPRPEYPRPRLTRERWLGLNGVWGFGSADDGESPPFGERLPETVLVPFPVESALSGVQREESRMWYRRTFSLPDGWDERVRLHFEAVDFEATVYVDGQQVGSHAGGYDPFATDIADALADGEGDDHELVVDVVDPTDDGQQPLGKQRDEPEQIYYTSCSGIWGSVWLEPVPDPHVASLDTAPDLDNEELRLTVETDARDGAAGTTRVRATVVADGTEVETVAGPADEKLAVPVPDPRLWSPDDPFLYDLQVELLFEDEVVDTVGSYVGMRSVGRETVDGTPRFTLNGEPVFHMGTLDQGYWPDGVYTAPTDEALQADLQAHVDMGFNAVRKHVKVEPRRWYYHADRLGLLVWQDMAASAVRGERPRESARQQFETGLRRMVAELDSHPSVVAWVPFNEGWGTFDVLRIVDLIREIDPNRPIDAQSGIGVCEGAGRICGSRGAGDVRDYHNYPGPGSVPTGGDQVAVLGEYGGVGLKIPDHLWSDDREYSYATAADRGELTDLYVRKLAGVRAMAAGCGGLAAAFYTQLTDVEREINGLLTYDRQVEKVDVERVRQAHEALFEAVDSSTDASDETAAATEGDPAGVAYWPLDAGEGPVAEDRVGGHDAQFEDLLSEPPKWVDGRVGGAVAFDGDHDVLDTGASVVDTSGAFGAAAWVRLAERGVDRAAVSQDGDSESAFALEYRDGPGQFAFAAGTNAAVGGPAVETGRWYHVAGTVADCTARLYVDGQEAASAEISSPVGSEGRTVIGRGQAGGVVTDYWEGRIDEVHLYERALSAADVRRLVEQG